MYRRDPKHAFWTINLLMKIRDEITFRSICESMASVWWQANRKTQNANIQVHAESCIQRVVFLQCPMGEDQRVFVGCYGYGLWQHRPERAYRPHPISRCVNTSNIDERSQIMQNWYFDQTEQLECSRIYVFQNYLIQILN